MQHVLHKNERLAPRTLEDEFQIAADDQRSGFHVLLTHMHRNDSRTIHRYLNLVLVGSVLGILGDLEDPCLVRVDQPNVQLLDACDLVPFAPVSLQVDGIDVDRE